MATKNRPGHVFHNLPKQSKGLIISNTRKPNCNDQWYGSVWTPYGEAFFRSRPTDKNTGRSLEVGEKVTITFDLHKRHQLTVHKIQEVHELDMAGWKENGVLVVPDHLLFKDSIFQEGSDLRFIEDNFYHRVHVDRNLYKEKINSHVKVILVKVKEPMPVPGASLDVMSYWMVKRLWTLDDAPHNRIQEKKIPVRTSGFFEKNDEPSGLQTTDYHDFRRVPLSTNYKDERLQTTHCMERSFENFDNGPSTSQPRGDWSVAQSLNYNDERLQTTSFMRNLENFDDYGPSTSQPRNNRPVAQSPNHGRRPTTNVMETSFKNFDDGPSTSQPRSNRPVAQSPNHSHGRRPTTHYMETSFDNFDDGPSTSQPRGNRPVAQLPRHRDSRPEEYSARNRIPILPPDAEMFTSKAVVTYRNQHKMIVFLYNNKQAGIYFWKTMEGPAISLGIEFECEYTTIPDTETPFLVTKVLRRTHRFVHHRRVSMSCQLIFTINLHELEPKFKNLCVPGGYRVLSSTGMMPYVLVGHEILDEKDRPTVVNELLKRCSTDSSTAKMLGWCSYQKMETYRMVADKNYRDGHETGQFWVWKLEKLLGHADQLIF